MVNNFPSKIAIIGVGSIGSKLAYSLCLSRNISSIKFFDSDILNENNFPFCGCGIDTAKEKDFLKCPKTLVLKHLILDNNKNIEIEDYNQDFNADHAKSLEDFFLIDCRDSFTKICPFHIKLCMDINIGRIIVNPSYTHEKSFSRYVEKPDEFFINLFVNDFIKKMCFDQNFIEDTYAYIGTERSREFYINYHIGQEFSK
jgi:hypothetical protein